MRLLIECDDFNLSIYVMHNQELITWISGTDNNILRTTKFGSRHPLTVAYGTSRWNEKIVSQKQNLLTMKIFTSLVLL